MDYRPLALAGLRVQAGDVGGHEVAAPHDRPSEPAAVIRFGQAIDDDILQRDRFLALVGDDVPIHDVQVIRILIPGFGHQVKYLAASVTGGANDGVAHAPGEAAGNGLPLVWAVLRIHGRCHPHPLVGHAQHGSGHLGHHGERPLAKLLPAHAQG